MTRTIDQLLDYLERAASIGATVQLHQEDVQRFRRIRELVQVGFLAETESGIAFVREVKELLQ